MQKAKRSLQINAQASLLKSRKFDGYEYESTQCGINSIDSSIMHAILLLQPQRR
jgi:hypothetical protein